MTYSVVDNLRLHLKLLALLGRGTQSCSVILSLSLSPVLFPSVREGSSLHQRVRPIFRVFFHAIIFYILYLYASFILKAAALNTLYFFLFHYCLMLQSLQIRTRFQMLDTWGPSKTIHSKGIYFILFFFFHIHFDQVL